MLERGLWKQQLLFAFWGYFSDRRCAFVTQKLPEHVIA